MRDPSWIFKVAKPNVTIDLIFRSEGRTEMGAEILQRAEMKAFEGLTVRVPSVEDMSVHEILMDTDERPGHWHGAMTYLKHVRDWDYLIERARCLAPRKVLAALLYADDVGVTIPHGALRALGDHALPGETDR